jgi:hypothetical protein
VSWSDYPCDICGENDGFTRSEVYNGVSAVFCGDCQKKYEEKLGYSHIIEEIKCPTCHHRRVKIRRYNCQDKGIHECEECHKFFAWTTTFKERKLCEECALRASKEEKKWPEKKCPECNRALAYIQKTRISGWVVGIWDCTCGYESEPVKIKKLTNPPRPKGVPTLEEVLA